MNYNVEKITKIRSMLLSILFFFIGATFQGYMTRRISCICYFIILAVIVVLMIKDSSFRIYKLSNIFDVRDILLIIAMVTFRIATYLYYESYEGIGGHFAWAAAPIMLYLIGKYLILYNENNTYNTHLKVTVPLGLGFILFNLVAVISYYAYGPVEGAGIEYDARNWYMYRATITTGDIVPRVTFYTFYPLLFAALFIWAAYTFKRNKHISLTIMITGLLSALWFWFQVQTRLPFIVWILSVVISLVLIYVDKIVKNGFKQYKKKTVVGILTIIIIGGIIALCFVFDVGGIKDIYLSSTFARDASLLENPRIKLAWSAISNLGNYPLGNNHTQVFSGIEHSHVFWTELGYCGGIIPFVAGVAWLFFIFKDIIYIIVSRTIELEEKLLLILSFLAVFSYSCTESYRTMFAPFMVMLFAGLIRGKVLVVKKSLAIKQERIKISDNEA